MRPDDRHATHEFLQTPQRIELVLLLTAFVAATYGFGVYLFPAIFGAIRAELSLSYAALGGISGLVQASIMVSALAAGALSVHFGPLKMILAAGLVCAASLSGLAFATSVWGMGALLMALGACAVIVWVPMVEVAREALAPEHHGKALGLLSSGTSYGVFVNSCLMVTVLPALGWRWVWGVTGAAVALLVLVAAFRLRGIQGHAASAARSHADDPPRSFRDRLRILATPTTGLLMTITGLDGLACTPFQTYLSAYLQGEAGRSAADAAFAWRLVGLVGMFSGVVIGVLADRITVRRAMALTHLVLAGACLAVVQLSLLPGQAMLVVAAVAFGTAFYAAFGLLPAYISQSFGKGDAAMVFSLGNISLGLGGMAGNLAVGLVKDASGSFAGAYLAMGGAAMLAVLVSLALPALSPRRPGPGPAGARTVPAPAHSHHGP